MSGSITDTLLLVREQERMKLWRKAFLQRADRTTAVEFADKVCADFLARFDYGVNFKPEKVKE